MHELINYAGLTSQLHNHTLRIITTKFHQDLMDQIQDTLKTVHYSDPYSAVIATPKILKISQTIFFRKICQYRILKDH